MSSIVAVIVQARMSSSRLPGKVLMPLAGAPSIVRMLERVRRVQEAHHCVVATSVDSTDDVLADACANAGLSVTRGSLGDVLQRMVDALPDDADVVVRLTGDCPLVDPELVDKHIRVFLAEQCNVDYVTNAVIRTMPKGLDVEVVSRDALERAAAFATEPYDREHVLPWVRRHMRTRSVTQAQDLSALRWTLDSALDYATISGVYAELYAENQAFSSLDVYRTLLARPELIQVDERKPLTDGERTAWVARIERHLRTLKLEPEQVSWVERRGKEGA